LVAISLIALPNLSLAETNVSTTSKANPEKRNVIKAAIDTKQEAIKNSVEEMRHNAIVKIEERVGQFVQTVIDRYNAATARLEKLADRIDSRIAKMEAAKIDVSKAKELMTVARVKIETARVSIVLINLPTSVASSTTSTTIASLKEDYKTSKTQIDKAKTDLKAAQAVLVDIINNLKPGDKKLKGSSSTTTTEATTN
jgi:exonuclease VII small subunit